MNPDSWIVFCQHLHSQISSTEATRSAKNEAVYFRCKSTLNQKALLNQT